MSVELYSAKEFGTTYEREALNQFAESMGNRFGSKEELYIILANYIIGGRPIDLTVLKRDAVVVIELKYCNEAFSAYENKDWKTENGKVVGHPDYNPFNQVMDYRNIWINFLKENKSNFQSLKGIIKGEKPFCYTKAYVVIYPYMKKNCKNNIPEGNWRFRLCGLNELTEKISNETNEIINFSNKELQFIATNLLSMGNPKVFQSTSTSNLKEQIIINIHKLDGAIKEKEIEIVRIKNENEILRTYTRNKDNEINLLKNEIYGLKKQLQDKDAVIKKTEERNAEDVNIKRFQKITNYIISEYIGHLNKEKATNLIKLSDQFGITQNQAIEIFNKIYKAAKTTK